MGVNSARAEIEGDDPDTVGIDESAKLTNAGALSLSAIGDHTLTTTAEAGAGGAVAISPAIALGVGVNLTRALLPDGEDLSTDGDLTLSAMHTGSTITRAEADAAGEKAGFGVGFGLTVAVDQALAELDRDVTSASGNAVIKAHTLSDASTTANASALGAKPPAAGSTGPANADEQTSSQYDFATGRPELSGTTLPALPKNGTQTSGGSGISIGAALGVNVAVASAEAEITQGTTLEMQGASSTVTFSAANDTDAAANANASAVGKGKLAPTAGPAAATPVPPVTGGVSLTFTDNGAQADSIARSSGNWTTDGFTAGATITVAGTISNNTATGTTNTIASISTDGLTLTLNAADALTNETASGEALAVKKSDDPTVAVTGGQTISFADNATGGGDTRDTITRSTGSWLADRYKAGDTVNVSGTTSNNGRYRIAEITQDGRVLILAVADTLTGEEHASGAVKVELVPFGVMSGAPSLNFFAAPGANPHTIQRSAGSWIEDGFTGGDVITVGGAAANNNTYTIKRVTAQTLFLADGYFLSTASNVAGASVAVTIRPETAATTGSPTLTLTHADSAADTITRNNGHWLDDGFAVGDTITVNGTTVPNNSYTITAISTNGRIITLDDDDVLGDAMLGESQSVERKAPVTTTAAGSSGIGAGVAAAINTAVVTNRAAVEGDVTSHGLTVEALMDGRDDEAAGSHKKHSLGAAAVAGASGGDFGAAGSFALNVGVTSSEAYLGRGITVNAGDAGNRGDVTISAANISASTVLASALERDVAKTKPAAAGGTATATGNSIGMGGSFALNVGVNTARAEIEGDDGDVHGAKLTNAGALSLTAIGHHALSTTSRAGAGGDFAISPTIALTVGVNQTTAELPYTGDGLDIGGGLTLSATHSGSANTMAQADAAGDKAAFGAAVGLTVEVDRAIALMDRDVTSRSGNVVIEAHNQSESSATVKASATGAKPPTTGATGGAGAMEPATADAQANQQFSFATDRKEVKNTGTTMPALPSASDKDNGGADVAISAALGVNVGVSEALATITEDTRLNALGGSVTVTSSNDTDAHSLADAAAVGKASSTKPWETSTNISGGLTLTFADNADATGEGADTKDTITRSAGSWTADGFVVGDGITVTGTQNNNTTATGSYTASAISADGLTLTVAAADTLNNEEASGTKLVVKKKVPDPAPSPLPAAVVTQGGPDIVFSDNGSRAGTITLSSGNWLTNGYKNGDTITVVGTNSANDGTYQVADITRDGRVLILTNGASLASAVTTFSGAAVKVERHHIGLLNGHPQLSFADKGTAAEPDTPDTITRQDGSWIVDGFTVGQTISVSGTENNNKKLSIAAISDDGKTLTLAASDQLSDETPDLKTTKVERVSKPKTTPFVLAAGETLNFTHNTNGPDTISRSTGNWIEQQFAVGDRISVDGTNSNNSTYTVDRIQANGSTANATLVLVATDTLTNESGVDGTNNAGKALSIKRSDVSDSTETRFGIGVGVAINAAVVSNKAVIEGDVIETAMLQQYDKVVMRGSPDVLLSDNSGEPDPRDTITRSRGSWIDDGFAVNDVFTIGGDSDNADVYTIAAISGDGLTLFLDNADTLTPHPLMSGSVDLTLTDNEGQADERDTIIRSAGSWSADGFKVGRKITVDGDNTNTGEYTIDEISADGLTLFLDADDTLSGFDGPQSGLSVIHQVNLSVERRNPVILHDTAGLVFSHSGTAKDTITRVDGGSWTADGFTANDLIKLFGDDSNTDFYSISGFGGPNDSVLILSDADALVASSVKSDLSVDRHAPVVMTGSPDLILIDNAGQDDARDTITRSGGSWSDDGFEVGQPITIDGDSNNTGEYTIDEISEDGLTLFLDAADSLNNHGPVLTGTDLTLTDNADQTDERDTITRSGGSWSDDGFSQGDEIRIYGDSNNTAVFTIDEISSDTITRSGGSWSDDGFSQGDEIRIYGDSNNTAVFTIDEISSDGLTLHLDAKDSLGGYVLPQSGLSVAAYAVPQTGLSVQHDDWIVMADTLDLTLTDNGGQRDLITRADDGSDLARISWSSFKVINKLNTGNPG